MVNKIYVVARRVLKQVRRDRRTLLLLIWNPIIIMVLFGYALGGGGDVHAERFLIVNNDVGILKDSSQFSFSEKIIEKIMEDDVFSVELYNVYDLARTEVEEGRARGVVYFGEDFTKNIIAQNPFDIEIYIDSTDQAIYSSMFSALQTDIQKSLPIKNSVNIKREFAYTTRGFKGIDLSTPIVLSFTLFLLVLLITVLITVREKTQATNERLFVSPIKSWELMLGYLFSLSLIALIQATILLSFSYFIFGSKILGSIPLVYSVAIYFAIGSVGLGIFIGFASKTELQAIQLVPLIFVPTILLSGVLVSTDVLPWFLHPISRIIPVTYAIDALRNIMLRGLGIREILGDLLAISIFVFLSMTISTLTMKKSEGLKLKRRFAGIARLSLVLFVLLLALYYADTSRKIDIERTEVPEYKLSDLTLLDYGQGFSEAREGKPITILGKSLPFYFDKPREHYFVVHLYVYQTADKRVYLLKYKIEKNNASSDFVIKDVTIRFSSSNGEVEWNDLDDYTQQGVDTIVHLNRSIGYVFKDNMYGKLFVSSDDLEFSLSVEVKFVDRYLLVEQVVVQNVVFHFADGKIVVG
jgi:ABC-2 type transport system permease protein